MQNVKPQWLNLSEVLGWTEVDLSAAEIMSRATTYIENVRVKITYLLLYARKKQKLIILKLLDKFIY